MIATLQQIESYISINIKVANLDWDPATAYAFGDVAFFEHYDYKSIVDDNVGNNPADSSTKWLLWSISNRYAQIDLRSTTDTVWDSTTATDVNDGALLTSFVNNGYDLIAMGKTHGSNMLIELYNDSDVLVWSDNEIVYDRPTSNSWHGYYFDDFRTDVDQNFIFRPPVIAGGYFKVRVDADVSNMASVGYLIGGNSIYLGDTLYGVSVGLDDNSLIETDSFGIKSIKKRTASESLDLDVVFGANQIQFMKRKARELQGEVALFIGDETVSSQYEYLPILGYIESYTSVLSNSVISQGSYSLKEII